MSRTRGSQWAKKRMNYVLTTTLHSHSVFDSIPVWWPRFLVLHSHSVFDSIPMCWPQFLVFIMVPVTPKRNYRFTQLPFLLAANSSGTTCYSPFFFLVYLLHQEEYWTQSYVE